MRMLQMLVLPLIVSSLVTGERTQAGAGLQDSSRSPGSHLERRLFPSMGPPPQLRTSNMEHAPLSESLAKAPVPIRAGF